MSDPLVSVIIPFYNEERYLADAIESVHAQTYQNFEMILIDDNSTDRSAEICRGFQDPRIRLCCKNCEERSLAASRNFGIVQARGQYVMMQDADDVSAPTRIQEQLAQAMEKPGRRVVGSVIRRVENGRERIVWVPEMHDEIVKGFHRVRKRTTIVCGTILAPRDLLLKIPYRTNFKYMQDWDHILRLYESGLTEFYNCQQPLYTYFIRSKGVLFRPDWLDYNLLVRSCQQRRNQGLEEFLDLESFKAHLQAHPAERFKWGALRSMIKVRDQISLAIRALQASQGNESQHVPQGVQP